MYKTWLPQVPRPLYNRAKLIKFWRFSNRIQSFSSQCTLLQRSVSSKKEHDDVDDVDDIDDASEDLQNEIDEFDEFDLNDKENKVIEEIQKTQQFGDSKPSLRKEYLFLKDRISTFSSVSQVFKLLDELKAKEFPITCVTGTWLLQRLFDLREPHAAMKLFDKLVHEFSLKPDNVMWIIFVLKLASSSKYKHKSVRYFYQMLEAGVIPPEKVFCKMILELATRGVTYTKDCVKLYECMQSHNVPITFLSLNAMLYAYFKSRDYQKALKFYEETKNKFDHHDRFTYTILIKIYSSLHLFDKVNTIINEVKRNKSLQDNKMFSTLFNYFTEHKLCREGMNFYEWLRSQNVVFDKRLHDNIFKFQAQCLPLDEIETQFQRITEMYPNSHFPYGVMMDVYNRHQFWSKTIRLYEILNEKKFRINSFYLSFVVEACKELHDSTFFWSIFDTLTNFKIVKAPLATRILEIAAEFKDPDKTLWLFDKLFHLRVPISLLSYYIFIQSICDTHHLPFRRVHSYWTIIRSYYRFFIDVPNVLVPSVQKFTNFFANKMLPPQLEQERKRWMNRVAQNAITQEDKDDFLQFLDKCFQYMNDKDFTDRTRRDDSFASQTALQTNNLS